MPRSRAEPAADAAPRAGAEPGAGIGRRVGPPAAVVLLNFGEPERADATEVQEYLQRIFFANAVLEPGTPEEARRRSRELATSRAPGLVEDYDRIGGSPLGQQARQQARALEAELTARDIPARTYVGMQFTRPSIPDAVRAARADGAERLIGLPVFPVCGRSTTVAALEALSAAVESEGWDVDRCDIAGWHSQPGYLALRAEGIRVFAREAGIDLRAPGTRLWFSAHGTPLAYLDRVPYTRYVEACCRSVASAIGLAGYALGYQNHGSRSVPWTEPANGALLRKLRGEGGVQRVVVVPISFMHEQSETLAELDHDLRGEVEAAGLEFHRVPVPHDDSRFVAVLADLVAAAMRGTPGSCRCRPDGATMCLNVH